MFAVVVLQLLIEVEGKSDVRCMRCDCMCNVRLGMELLYEDVCNYGCWM